MRHIGAPAIEHLKNLRKALGPTFRRIERFPQSPACHKIRKPFERPQSVRRALCGDQDVRGQADIVEIFGTVDLQLKEVAVLREQNMIPPVGIQMSHDSAL